MIVRRVFTYLLPKRFKEKTNEIFEDFYANLLHPTKLALPLFVTLCVWILIYTESYLIALSLGVETIPWVYFLILFPIATIVGLLPITVAGLGTRELSLIGLFSVFNVAPEFMSKDPVHAAA